MLIIVDSQQILHAMRKVRPGTGNGTGLSFFRTMRWQGRSKTKTYMENILPHPCEPKSRHMKRLVHAAVFLLWHGLAISCHAGSLPRWELGAGLGVLNISDYRGADTRSTYVLPAPYFVYRGSILQADRSGVRAALFRRERLAINLSLNVALAADTKHNPTRQGMSRLRPTVELGPTANFRLWQSASDHSMLELRLPLRAGLTVESSPQHIGWLFSPNLHLRTSDPAHWGGWKLGVQGGPLYGSRDYNSYFYSVKPEEERTGRPAYAAGSGYAGTQLTATVSKRFPRYWVGAFLRYDNLAGAIFKDSPLVQRRNALAAGVALAWVFGVSSAAGEGED